MHDPNWDTNSNTQPLTQPFTGDVVSDEVGTRSRMACGLVAILMSLFGLDLGIHNFMLGFNGRATVQLVLFILNAVGYVISFLLMLVLVGFITIWINIAITAGLAIWGLIEGIIILSNKDFRDADGKLLRN